MKVPLERMCYFCRILDHLDCEGSVQYQGVTATCLCQQNNHEADLDPDYEPLLPFPERVTHHPDEPPVSWVEVLAAYGALTGQLDRLNRLLQPQERVHVPFALQEVLADYIEERKARDSIEKTATHDAS